MAEDAAQRIARYVASELVRRGWTQAELAQAAGVNKNTITSFMRGEASPRTVKKVEAGLGMTPGTLAAAGEDAPAPGSPNPLADVSDMALLAELGRRLDKASGQRAGQPSRLRPVPSWADPVAARELHEPKGAPEPPGEEDVSQDPEDWETSGDE